MSATASAEVHFAQHLAANERRVRDKGLAKVRRWIHLRSQTHANEFDEEGMMQLWKGLFYSMWMADKPLVQEELADNISSLIHAFSKPSLAYAFVGCFFKTMGRRHDHIDKYRIDKFLMLARRFFRESLKYLKGREWQHKHVQKFLEVLRQSVLATKHDPRQMALGFRLHVLDIFLEELARVGEGELPQKRAHNFLEPFYEILTYCKSPMVVEGVRNKIFYELVKLSAGCMLQEEDGEEEVENGEEDDDDDGQGLVDDEATLDETAFDSETGEVAQVSDDEDEEKLSKPRKSDRGFIADDSAADDDEEVDDEEVDDEEVDDEEVDDEEVDDEDVDDEDEEGDLEEQLIREREDAAEVHLLPVDFDLSAVKESLKEFAKVRPMKGINKRAIHSVIKKIVDLENGVDPFALPEEDSGSDLELDENELKQAAKRLKLLERKYADEAENFLVPDKSEKHNDDLDLDIEGGEDDLDEFEQTFGDRPVKSKRSKRAKSSKRHKSRK